VCHGRRRVPYTRPKFPKDDLTSSMGTRSMVGKGCSSSLRRQCRRCRMQDSHAFEPHFPWFPQLLHGYTTKKKSFGGIGSISLLCNSVLTKALALIVTSPAPTAAQSGTLRVFVCRSAPLAGHRRDFPILKIGPTMAWAAYSFPRVMLSCMSNSDYRDRASFLDGFAMRAFESVRSRLRDFVRAERREDLGGAGPCRRNNKNILNYTGWW